MDNTNGDDGNIMNEEQVSWIVSKVYKELLFKIALECPDEKRKIQMDEEYLPNEECIECRGDDSSYPFINLRSVTWNISSVRWISTFRLENIGIDPLHLSHLSVEASSAGHQKMVTLTEQFHPNGNEGIFDTTFNEEVLAGNMEGSGYALRIAAKDVKKFQLDAQTRRHIQMSLVASQKISFNRYKGKKKAIEASTLAAYGDSPPSQPPTSSVIIMKDGRPAREDITRIFRDIMNRPEQEYQLSSDPFQLQWRHVLTASTPYSSSLHLLVQIEGDLVEEEMEDVNQIVQSTISRCMENLSHKHPELLSQKEKKKVAGLRECIPHISEAITNIIVRSDSINFQEEALSYLGISRGDDEDFRTSIENKLRDMLHIAAKIPKMDPAVEVPPWFAPQETEERTNKKRKNFKMEAPTEENSERDTPSIPIEESQPQPEEKISEEKANPAEDNAAQSKVESVPEPSEAPPSTIVSDSPPKQPNTEDEHQEKIASEDATVARPVSKESDVKPTTTEEVQTSVSAAALAAARDEWAQLENSQQPGGDDITFEAAWKYFEKMDLTEEKKKIITTDTKKQGFFKSFFGSLLGPKLSPDHVRDRDTIFAIAQVQFNEDDNVHHDVLQTIRRKLTGEVCVSPRFGGHWEQIGFQGNDPATDLRGAGMLGLLQTLHMIYKLPNMSQTSFTLSRDPDQGFPWCVVSINMSRIALECMREGILNSVMSGRNAVSALDAANQMHHAAFFHLYRLWVDEGLTVVDFGQALNQTGQTRAHHPKQKRRRR
ncbi:hypothetical protein PROFUN_10737 [Planoprotostelium fungivorum]|uniref:ELMO domain-containing protein n=1 Tax=Planoprotostelium fungivorum TaxID=1890364 RepID=A0A2P6N7X8_9EUKA|nr:hypothetical protein PROFUN_10737 [Planoprotostelium fungivorum]